MEIKASTPLPQLLSWQLLAVQYPQYEHRYSAAVFGSWQQIVMKISHCCIEPPLLQYFA